MTARVLVPIASGLLFGAGLVISDMANPERVLAFLTIGPGWDPTLAFVMAGAVAVSATGFLLLRRRTTAWTGDTLPPRPSGPIDRRLLIGAALFGLGWGLSGYCPGPALVGAALGAGSALVLVPAMLIGGVLARRL